LSGLTTFVEGAYGAVLHIQGEHGEDVSGVIDEARSRLTVDADKIYALVVAACVTHQTRG
jgi:hypothetical protein